MRPGRSGFSLIELLVVIAIVGVMVGLAVPAIGKVQAQRRVANARDSFVWLSSRARMAAVEHGGRAVLEIDPARNQALVISRKPGALPDTLEVVRYGDTYGVQVQTENAAAIEVCYDPRGYALPICTTPGLPLDASFSISGSEQARARIHPLGQVSR